jgi:hypothetical protein
MSDTDADGNVVLVSVAICELCRKLRSNDPLILHHNSKFAFSSCLSSYTDTTRSTVYYGYTEAESIAVFRALEENTNVKHIDFMLFERHCTQRYALVAAEYLESSKSRHFQELPAAIPLFVQALSRNTSVMELTLVAAEYLESSKIRHFQELPAAIPLFVQALSLVIRL